MKSPSITMFTTLRVRIPVIDSRKGETHLEPTFDIGSAHQPGEPPRIFVVEMHTHS